MNYRKTELYDMFSCVGGECPATCCAGWQIMIDEKKQEEYLQVPGKFGARLFRSVDWTEGSFVQSEDRRCSFLNKENLCDLYTELGPDMLCDTCRKYPRHEEEFEDLREWSLSLSCPIAARMILEQEGKLRLLEWEDDREEVWEDYEDFDALLFSQLLDAREELFEIICDSTRSLDERMQLALEFAEQLQICLDEDRFFEMEEAVEVCAKNRKNGGKKFIFEKDLWKESRARMELLDRLEVLQEEWPEIQEMQRELLMQGPEAYGLLRSDFLLELEKNEKLAMAWNRWGEQLLQFFVYTYFCGAVYDGWIYSKVMLAVFSLQCIRDMAVAYWKKHNGSLPESEFCRLAYRYARETEHSDLNLDILEEHFTEAWEQQRSTS